MHNTGVHCVKSRCIATANRDRIKLGKSGLGCRVRQFVNVAFYPYLEEPPGQN